MNKMKLMEHRPYYQNGVKVQMKYLLMDKR